MTRDMSVLHSEDIHNLYCSGNIVRANKDKTNEDCNTHGKLRNVYRIFVRKSEGKVLLGEYVGEKERLTAKEDL